ncbi:MAG: energy-coupling factor transporter transmembrane component T [Candidatus Cloacimonetes bacterium]|nr:energy-coupling factor transporter transmembrane component T [Candidatus Cloacimonadota bacterium]
MKFSLRSALVFIACITSLSLSFRDIVVQTILIGLVFVFMIISDSSMKNLRITVKRVSRISRVILSLALVQIIFRRSGSVILQWWILKITEEGIEFAVSSSLRLFLIVFISGLLLNFSIADYFISLKKWKFPDEIIFIIASTIHFVPILNTEIRLEQEALLIRGIDLSKLPLKNRIQAYSKIALPVIGKAVSKAKYQTASMELRAFRLYPNRTYYFDNVLGFNDYLLISVSLLTTSFFLYSHLL